MITHTYHPIIDHFHATFMEKKGYTRAGMRARNMDEFSVGQKINFIGAFLVCASAIKLQVKECIHFTGLGGGLMAGTRIELESPDILLFGTENDPIQIVVTENLTLKSTDLKIQNVIFYLLDGAHFSLKDSTIAKLENVRVVQLTTYDIDQTFAEKEVANWKDEKALIAFINK